MSLKVGDTFFSRNGQPGVVVGRNPKTDRLEVEREGPRYEKARSYGFINGLSPAERKDFEAIVEEARQSSNPKERLAKLQSKVEESQMDPKRQVVSRYLEGEISHLMHSESIHPQVFEVDEDKT